MFENTELGHVRFSSRSLASCFLFSQQPRSGDACRARRHGPEAGDELRVPA